MRRRDFIKVIGGGAAAWPLVARAQQAAMPVVGFINAASPTKGYERNVAAFLKGLGETGFVDGQNVTVEYRWAGGQNDRLPCMDAQSPDVRNPGQRIRQTLQPRVAQGERISTAEDHFLERAVLLDFGQGGAPSRGIARLLGVGKFAAKTVAAVNRAGRGRDE